MVTLGMDFGSFSQGLPSEKMPKSIPRVTILLLIDTSWWILCLPGHIKEYNIQQISYFLQTSAMADQRKAPESHYDFPRHILETQLKRDLPPARASEVYDAPVVDSGVLEHYLMCKT